MPQYMLLLFADPSQGPAEGSPEAMAEWQAWGTYTRASRTPAPSSSGEPLELPTTATTVRDAQRRPRGDRRAVRRDQGMAGRLLRHRGGRPRRRARPRVSASERRLRPRRGAPGDAGPPGCEQRRRAGLPRGVRSRPGHADPPSRRRLPAGRGRAAGRTSPSRWPPGRATASRPNPGAWITTRRGARRSIACAASAPCTTACPALHTLMELDRHEEGPSPRTRRSAATTACASLFTCCHPALAMDAARRADAAHSRRPDDGRDRPRLPVPEPTMAQRLARAKRKIARRAHPVQGAERRRGA